MDLNQQVNKEDIAINDSTFDVPSFEEEPKDANYSENMMNILPVYKVPNQEIPAKNIYEQITSSINPKPTSLDPFYFDSNVQSQTHTPNVRSPYPISPRRNSGGSESNIQPYTSTNPYMDAPFGLSELHPFITPSTPPKKQASENISPAIDFRKFFWVTRN